MRTHTDDYKKSLIGYREIKNEFKYIDNGIEKEVSEDDLVFVKPILNSELFKTTMKQLDFETKIKFKEGTKIHFKSGLKVNDEYEYIDYGDYTIYNVEYLAASQTYYYTCYDNMLKTMVAYEPLNITYPIWVRSYIDEIANACGLQFAYKTDRFGNYNVEIKEDYFKEGNYTYRDILDYLCQVIGGWLYIDNNNKLSVKYPTETNEIFNADYLNYINVSFEKKYGPINSIVFSRANELDNLVYNDETSIETNGLCQVKFSDNPFLSGEDRENYMTEGIFGLVDKIIGLEFYINDLETKGIPYLELGDIYSYILTDKMINALKSGIVKSGLRKAQSESVKYKCLMINSEDEYRGGLKQLIYTPEPEDNVGEYMTTTPTNNSLKNAEILVNKNAGEIILKANSDGKVVQARLDADADDGSLFEVKADNIKLEGYTTINNGFSVDLNGNMTANNGTFNGTITSDNGEIGGFNINATKLSKVVSGIYDYNYYDMNLVPTIIMGRIYKDEHIKDVLDVDDNGEVYANDYGKIRDIIDGTLTNTKNISGTVEINSTNPKNCIVIKDNNGDLVNSIGLGGINTSYLGANNIVVSYPGTSYNDTVLTTINGKTGNITCVSLTQTSKEETKKNFEKLHSGLDIIKNIDIYKYNLLFEKDDDKKHIGLVIGDNYKYSKEVTSADNDGIDLYSFVSVCCKAIQEQQEEINQLKEEIKSLKESDRK